MASKVTYLIDTNYIVRYLIGDVALQQKKAVEYLKKAEKGEVKLIIKPIVVAETCFVLESFYNNTRSEIADTFEVFLSQKWLQVEDREVLHNIWPHYRNNLHFVDSYLLASAKLHKQKILSFDKKLLKAL